MLKIISASEKDTKTEIGRQSLSDVRVISSSIEVSDASPKNYNFYMSSSVIKRVFWFVLINAFYYALTLHFFVEHERGDAAQFVDILWDVLPLVSADVTLILLFVRRSSYINLFKFMFQLLKKSKVQSRDMCNNVTIFLFATIVLNNIFQTYHRWVVGVRSFEASVQFYTFYVCFVSQVALLTTINYLIGILAGDFKVLVNVLREERKNIDIGILKAKHYTNENSNFLTGTRYEPPLQSQVVSYDRVKNRLNILFKMIEEEILLIDEGLELITNTFSVILLIGICNTITDVVLSAYFLLKDFANICNNLQSIWVLFEALVLLFFMNHPADLFKEAVSIEMIQHTCSILYNAYART